MCTQRDDHRDNRSRLKRTKSNRSTHNGRRSRSEIYFLFHSVSRCSLESHVYFFFLAFYMHIIFNIRIFLYIQHLMGIRVFHTGKIERDSCRLECRITIIIINVTISLEFRRNEDKLTSPEKK